MKKFLLTTFAALFISTSLFAAPYVSYLDFPQSRQDGKEFYSVIEIPQGSFTKYEIDEKTGHIIVDRYQSMPVVYPANYGSITSTLAGDGDPLDVLIYTREPIVPGAIIKVRPIGMINMIDGGELDNKVIAVPTSKIDPTYDNIKTIADLPKIESERLEAFFRVYKQLPEGRKLVELNGFESTEKAEQEVANAIKAFYAKKQ